MLVFLLEDNKIIREDGKVGFEKKFHFNQKYSFGSKLLKELISREILSI